MSIHTTWNKLSSRSQDILVAGLVTVFVCIILQITLISQVWWYRDTPFPVSVIAAPTATPTTSELSEELHAVLTIPSLAITVPIVWSQSTKESDFQKDLERGAIHYPGTPLPGQRGNSFIAAHSSDAYWKKGDYKNIFASLYKLNVGDSDIFITYYKGDEIIKKLSFKVIEEEVVSANDQRMFTQRDTTEITLVTCWPLSTSWRRLMIKAQLIE